MILSAINKKQTFAELINQANSMVTGVLHDGLKRSLNVLPGKVMFGGLRPGTTNEITITVKNEDSIAHRITIKPVMDKRIVVRQEEYGIIAPGMLKKIIVSIRVADDESTFPQTIRDTIQIVSKHDVFKIPVTATIVSEEEFNAAKNNASIQSGAPVQNSRVRERLNRAIHDSRMSRRSDGPELLTKKPAALDTQDDEGAENNTGGFKSFDNSKM